MLLPSQVAQLAHTVCQLILGHHELLIESLACSGKVLLLVLGREQGFHFPIQIRVPVVARAMTTVMTQVERLVALRCLGKLLGCK